MFTTPAQKAFSFKPSHQFTVVERLDRFDVDVVEKPSFMLLSELFNFVRNHLHLKVTNNSECKINTLDRPSKRLKLKESESYLEVPGSIPGQSMWILTEKRGAAAGYSPCNSVFPTSIIPPMLRIRFLLSLTDSM